MGKSGSSLHSGKSDRPVWQTRGRLAHRLRLEDGIRQELQDPSAILDPPSDAEREVAMRALQSVRELEARYLEDRNPVHVFDAIAQIGFARRTLREPIDFPPWIAAYLFASANRIMGQSVAWSPEVESPPAPVQQENGPVHRLGDSQQGLSASARLDTVLEALLFKQGPGRNPVLQAHGFYASVDRARTYARNRTNKLSSEQAIAEMNDPQLKVDDPQRKLRRDRRRIKPPKPTP
jgi:hypothetical protein